MACRLQKLFGADGDLADEDFLSAVEDAENQFVVPGRLSPGGGPVPPSVPSPAPGLQPLRLLGPQLGHRSGKPPSLRPLAGQGEQPAGCRGPPAGGAVPQDELDNDLFLAACMELEGPELPAGASAARPPPGRWEKPPLIRMGQESPQEWAVPKKLRVGEELVSPGSGELEVRQDPLPAPRAAPAPRLVLRPSAASACPPRPPTPPGRPGSSCGSVPAPRGPAPRPFQASPCQPGATSSSMGLRVPRTPMAQGPRQSCPPPRLPPANSPALMSCVEPPPRQPLRPAPASLQTPVVTNHLVQLVTAASKAPGAAPHLPPQRKTRRFPGPAGILPQQHAGKLLEEILISAPQTPAHGAVAKPRTEGLPSSSPPTEEDFGKGPWLAMKTELGLDERDPSCFLRTYSVVMVLRKVRRAPGEGTGPGDSASRLSPGPLELFPGPGIYVGRRGLSWAACRRPVALWGCPRGRRCDKGLRVQAALKQLPKNKVPSMAVMIKTLTRTNIDAGAVFRDPTGEMQGTVHRLLLEERQSELRPGSVLLLKQVGVFSPSHRNHYLNVTPNNLLKIYPPEPEGSFSQPSPAQREVREGTVLLALEAQGCWDPPRVLPRGSGPRGPLRATGEEGGGLGGTDKSSCGSTTILCWVLQVPAQAGLLRDHPAQPPWGVPAPGDLGQGRTGNHSTEQSPGGFSLHPQSPGPGREEPVGADGCDMGELGPHCVGRKSSTSCGKQMTWMGSWESCLRISSPLRPKLTAADLGELRHGRGAGKTVTAGAVWAEPQPGEDAEQA
ncbi:hypothetical protein QYF61_012689, partial [Mycteria americana]